MVGSFTFYAVRIKSLDNVPRGVRKFLDDFFTETKIFGTGCYVALGSDTKSPWGDFNGEDYKEDLEEDTSVLDWLSSYNPKHVFNYDWP